MLQHTRTPTCAETLHRAALLCGSLWLIASRVGSLTVWLSETEYNCPAPQHTPMHTDTYTHTHIFFYKCPRRHTPQVLCLSFGEGVNRNVGKVKWTRDPFWLTCIIRSFLVVLVRSLMKVWGMEKLDKCGPEVSMHFLLPSLLKAVMSPGERCWGLSMQLKESFRPFDGRPLDSVCVGKLSEEKTPVRF